MLADRRGRHAGGHLAAEFLCRPGLVGDWFRVENNVLIIAGALDGASGFLLSILMSKAMNRSFANVLFGAFGGAAAGGAAAAESMEGKSVRSISVEDAAIQLAYARNVIVIPGYGMAVAHAQHEVRELAEQIESRGGEVKFAIHPVAGRMPGHMNVLLAEANVPYDKLCDMDEINGEFPPDRRGAGDRRERRREPRRPNRPVQPDLRHADSQRRSGPEHHRAEAEHESRLCGHRERSCSTIRNARSCSATRRALSRSSWPR